MRKVQTHGGSVLVKFEFRAQFSYADEFGFLRG